jgi:hypothetical protein
MSETELSALWGETKIHLTFNESAATLVAGNRPLKTWLRPSSRWAGDVVLPIAEGTDVKAMWFDPSDGRLAYGVIKKPLASAKYILFPDAKLHVLISLADIVRCMEHSYKFKSSRDFVPLEFTFSFNRLEKGGRFQDVELRLDDSDQ